MADLGQAELLTIPETAALLRLKVSTIRAWLLQRRVPFVKLGGRVFHREQRRAYIHCGFPSPGCKVSGANDKGD